MSHPERVLPPLRPLRLAQPRRRRARRLRTPRPLVAALVVCLLLAAACTPGGGRKATPASGPARGILRVGYSADDYDNENRRNVGVTPLNTNVAETLVRLTPDFKVEPLLAERWELIPPTTWRFHLRPGVKFHDGKPLDAAAVKSGLFDRLAKVAGGGQTRAGEGSAKVVGDLTIDFTPVEANLRVPEMLAHPSRVVYSPGTDPATPVGTGPFTFVEYQRGERIVVARNPDYWGNEAKAERIEFTFYPNPADRLRALESGKIDLAFPIPQQDAAKLEEAGLTTVKTAVGSDVALYAAVKGLPPTNLLTDVGIRKAVALAIDRRKVVSQALGGNATSSATHVPPAMLGPHAAEVKGLAYDPRQARTLLDAANWRPGSDGIRRRDGRALELTLVSGYPSAEANRPVPANLRTQLRAVGIGLRIVEASSPQDYATRLFEGRGDLFLEQGTQSDGDPAFLPLLIHNWPASGSYAALFNPGPAYDAALAPALTSPDLDRVQAATAAALKEAIEVQAAIVPLAGLPRIYAHAPGVKGFVAHPSPFCVRWDESVFAGS